MSPRFGRFLMVLTITAACFLALVSVSLAQEPDVNPDADKGLPNPPAGLFDPGASGRTAGAPLLRGEGEFIPIPPQCTSNEVSATRFNTIVIPNAGTPVITSTLFVAFDLPYIWDMSVSTPISHTFSGDIDMTLQSPGGRVVTLTTDNGSNNDHVFGNVEWYDFADLDGTLPYTINPGLVTDHPYANGVGAGTLHPEESFGGLVGESTGTTWTLTINDDANQDGGTLNGWGLSFLGLNETPNTVFNSYSDPSAATAIPELAVLTRTITISGMPGVLHTIELNGLISHTNNADLDITLTSPDGRVATMTTDNGGTNDNVFVDTQWADRFSFSGQVPYTNTAGLTTDRLYANNVNAAGLVPEESMSVFRGINPNGTWTLTIVDDTAGNTGTLNGWALDLLTATCEDIAPDITLSDSSYSVTHDPAPTVTFDELTVGNVGNDNLTYFINEIPAGGGGTFSEKEPQAGEGCSGTGDIPWLDIVTIDAPGMGVGNTLPPGGSETHDLMFKSFGLQDGVYTATLCIDSSDPDESPLLLPLTLTVLSPDTALALSATVGTTAGACAPGDTIAVAAGTDVYYCYTATNTGDVPFDLHSLSDDNGTIFAASPVTLAPGASVTTVELGVEISATIQTTTSLTGTWSADDMQPFVPSVSVAPIVDIGVTGTPVLTNTDDAGVTQTLPFTFDYFGTAYNEVCVSSNGHMRFGTGGCSSLSNTLLPVFDYTGVVAVAWDDYVLPNEAGSAVLVETQGSAPNRVFIVQWENVRHFSVTTAERMTFQARLEEDGDIVFAYEDMDVGDPTVNNGASATVGLSDDGLDARVVNHNEPELGANLNFTFATGPAHSASAQDSTTVTILEPTAIALTQFAAQEGGLPYGWLLLLAGLALGLAWRGVRGFRSEQK